MAKSPALTIWTRIPTFGDIPGVLPSFLTKGQIGGFRYCLFSDINFSNSESGFSWISPSWKNLVSIVAKTLLL